MIVAEQLLQAWIVVTCTHGGRMHVEGRVPQLSILEEVAD